MGPVEESQLSGSVLEGCGGTVFSNLVISCLERLCRKLLCRRTDKRSAKRKKRAAKDLERAARCQVKGDNRGLSAEGRSQNVRSCVGHHFGFRDKRACLFVSKRY